jgi:hypothetical protein
MLRARWRGEELLEVELLVRAGACRQVGLNAPALARGVFGHSEAPAARSLVSGAGFG